MFRNDAPARIAASIISTATLDEAGNENVTRCVISGLGSSRCPGLHECPYLCPVFSVNTSGAEFHYVLFLRPL